MSKIVDISKALGYKFPSTIRRFTKRDLQLYALTIGFSKDPRSTADLKFTYERDPNF